MTEFVSGQEQTRLSFLPKKKRFYIENILTLEKLCQDKNKLDPNAEARFKTISEAYQVK
jgi:hypothetical protein